MDVITVCRTRGPPAQAAQTAQRAPPPSLCATCRIFSHPRSRRGASEALGPLKPHPPPPPRR